MKVLSLTDFYLRRVVVSHMSVSVSLCGLRGGGATATNYCDVHLHFAGVSSVEMNGCFAPGARVRDSSGFDGPPEGASSRTYVINVEAGRLKVVAKHLAASSHVATQGKSP